MVYSLPFNVLEFSKQDNNTPSIIFFTLADINVFQSKGLLYNKLDSKTYNKVKEEFAGIAKILADVQDWERV